MGRGNNEVGANFFSARTDLIAGMAEYLTSRLSLPPNQSSARARAFVHARPFPPVA